MTVVIAAIVSFLAALALVPICRRVALRLGYIATPKPDRWHTTPTPILGGIVIAIVPLVGSVLGADVQRFWPLLAAAAALFIVGLLDDVIGLRFTTRLAVQIAVASFLVFMGYRLGWFHSLTVDAFVTLFWLVGVTNAFNLLDNMDGLCAGIGILAGLALILSWLPGAAFPPETIYLAMLVGTMAGFLVFNFAPASIFMGDSGSLVIGVSLAALALATPERPRGSDNVLPFFAGPVLLLLVPILDTTLVTISRLLSGRSAAHGGRDHSSHRLVAMGLSERDAVLVLWGFGAVGGLLSALIPHVDDGWPYVAGVALLVASALLGIYLAQVRVYAGKDFSVARQGRFTPLVAHAVQKTRVAEMLLDVCLVAVCYYAAYRLRFDRPTFNSTFFQGFLSSLPLTVGIQTLTLAASGAYRSTWRHFGFIDALVLVRAVLFGTIAIVSVLLFAYRFEGFSRAVFAIHAMLLVVALVGSRASFRAFGELIGRRRQKGQRLIVYGVAGGLALRELLVNRALNYRMVGFVDDDPTTHGARIHGYRVLGGYDLIEALTTTGAVDAVIVASHAVPEERQRELESLCASHGVSLSKLHVTLEPIVGTS